MRIASSTVAVVVATLALAAPASAAVIVDFSGTFVSYPNPPSYYATLSGGSFSGTFTLADDLPAGDNTTMSFAAFTVSLYDSSNTLILTLSDSVAGGSGYVSSEYVSYYGGDIVNFYGPNGSYLQLVFPTGFTGTGSPSSSGPGSYSYAYAAPGDYAYVASANASVRSTPVPEAPTTLILAVGLSIVLALGLADRHSVAGR